ncbi:hypothetical protein APHAL10511_005947 [Amanita phalloides]|nr:hypothetical protein APHAL10511_005947 [Amanita phalloides]
MAPKKSIFRQPGARHFQLVHRSQRDPLIHDPDASQHVLKPLELGNARKGKTRSELESLFTQEELEHDKQARVGEAALYDIYYDDTQYDYMQHLRTVGSQEDEVESTLIEAPRPRDREKKHLDLELPQDLFASKTELPRNYESQQAIPESIAGFQPDMDPHLRQVLEALENDAFVDDELDDDFFADLVKDGERRRDEDIGFEEEEIEGQCGTELREDATWEERFAHFKKSREENLGEQSDNEFASEAGDTIHGLPHMSVVGGKKRRKGSSEASGYSMNSSSMYRNEALQTLDERFDQLMLKEYDKEGRTVSEDEDEDTDDVPELITSREDFEAMMSEFLDEYEILGRKMHAKLPGGTGTEKLELLWRSMGQVKQIKTQEDSEEDEVLMPIEIGKKDRWDCETVLSTYSNLENHPRIIRARDGKPVPRIRLHPITGLPSLEKNDATSEESDQGEERPAHQTIARYRNENKEDKKLRKATVKADKQIRRAAKKKLKEQFDVEMQAQKNISSHKRLILAATKRSK